MCLYCKVMSCLAAVASNVEVALLHYFVSISSLAVAKQTDKQS